DARGRFAEVEPRIREIHALARRADRDRQEETLGAAALLLIDEPAVERAPLVVEQQRILPRPLRDDALGEAGDKDDAERAAARLVRRADEHAAVPARRRLPVECDEAVVQPVARLVER